MTATQPAATQPGATVQDPISPASAPATTTARLTATQSLILAAAARRPRALAMPLPAGLHGAAARMAVTAMIARGLLEEVAADPRRSEPLWRETGNGDGTTLIATATGLRAAGIAPEVVMAAAAEGPKATRSAGSLPRPGSRLAQLIALLQAPRGACMAELVSATGWQPHSLRGAISGTLGRKLGLRVAATTEQGRGRVYRIAASEAGEMPF